MIRKIDTSEVASPKKVNNSEINAVRDLLFGDTVKTYNLELESLKQQILDQKNLLNDLVESTRKEILTKIDTSTDDMDSRFETRQKNLEERLQSIESSHIDIDTFESMMMALVAKMRKRN